MVEIDLHALAKRLQALNLLDTPFREFSRDDVLAMAQAVVDALVEGRMPYLRTTPSGRKELIMPFDAPEDLKTWKHGDGYLRLYKLLKMLGADEGVMRAYLGDDYEFSVSVHMRDCAQACPACGAAMPWKIWLNKPQGEHPCNT